MRGDRSVIVEARGSGPVLVVVVDLLGELAAVADDFPRVSTDDQEGDHVAAEDLERAVAFYRDTLGMRFLFQVPPGLAFFDCGGIRLMIDGIKSFVTGLSTAGRVLSAEAVHEFTERIINPRPVRKGTAGVPPPAMASPAWEEEKTQPPPGQQVSRARAIYDAS